MRKRFRPMPDYLDASIKTAQYLAGLTTLQDIWSETGKVLVNGKAIELTPIEFKLLACLVDHEGKVVSHDYLLNQVWGQDHKDARHYLKLYIWYLRQKLEADPTHPRMILTQRGVGYRLVSTTEPVEGQPAPVDAEEP